MTDTATSTETRKSHFGGKEHRIAQLALLQGRAEKLAGVFAGTDVGNMLNESVECVKDAIDSVKSLAADWKPAGRKSVAKAKFEPVAGSPVKIRKKKLGDYAVLSETDQQALTVIGVTGKFANCETASGVKIAVRISHLSARK